MLYIHRVFWQECRKVVIVFVGWKGDRLFTVYSFELFFFLPYTCITFKNTNVLIVIEAMWVGFFESFNKLCSEVLTCIQKTTQIISIQLMNFNTPKIAVTWIKQ